MNTRRLRKGQSGQSARSQLQRYDLEQGVAGGGAPLSTTATTSNADEIFNEAIRKQKSVVYASNFKRSHFLRQLLGLLLGFMVALFVFYNWDYFRQFVFKGKRYTARLVRFEMHRIDGDESGGNRDISFELELFGHTESYNHLTQTFVTLANQHIFTDLAFANNDNLFAMTNSNNNNNDHVSVFINETELLYHSRVAATARRPQYTISFRQDPQHHTPDYHNLCIALTSIHALPEAMQNEKNENMRFCSMAYFGQLSPEYVDAFANVVRAAKNYKIANIQII